MWPAYFFLVPSFTDDHRSSEALRTTRMSADPCARITKWRAGVRRRGTFAFGHMACAASAVMTHVGTLSGPNAAQTSEAVVTRAGTISPSDGDAAEAPNERSAASSDTGAGTEPGADALQPAREDVSGRGAENREADEPYSEGVEAEGSCEVARHRRLRVGDCPNVGGEVDGDVDTEDGEAENEGAESSMRHLRSRRGAAV
ncbi:unnamed protein product, partial [Tilletia caries]